MGQRDVASLGPNARVRTSTGAVSTVASVLFFPGVPTATGNWVVPSMRVSIGGVPAINSTSVGIGYTALPMPSSTGPLLITISDPRVSGT